MSSAITAAIAAALIFLSLAAWIIYQDLNERLRLEDERARFFRARSIYFASSILTVFLSKSIPPGKKPLDTLRLKSFLAPFWIYSIQTTGPPPYAKSSA
jgi:hypothetical protein